MGTNNRFKRERAIPAVQSGALPPWTPYWYKQVRQLSTTFQNLGPSPVFQTWGTVIIPANTWAYNKRLFMRAGLRLIIPPAVMPPNYNVQEQIGMTGVAPMAMPNPGPFVPAAGVFGTEISWAAYNDGANIYVWNDGLVQAKYAMNTDDNVDHIPFFASVGTGVVLTSQVTVTLDMKLPPAIPGIQLQALWLQAFIEQGTNLGKAVY